MPIFACTVVVEAGEVEGGLRCRSTGSLEVGIQGNLATTVQIRHGHGKTFISSMTDQHPSVPRYPSKNLKPTEEPSARIIAMHFLSTIERLGIFLSFLCRIVKSTFT